MEIKEQYKKRWEKPQLKIIKIDKTSGGPDNTYKEDTFGMDGYDAS